MEAPADQHILGGMAEIFLDRFFLKARAAPFFLSTFLYIR